MSGAGTEAAAAAYAPLMGEKSKPGANQKKQGKTLQEKRSVKKAKKAEKGKRTA